jgi:membrane protein HdeD
MSNQSRPTTTGGGDPSGDANRDELVPERRRDILLGALLIIAGCVILGDVVLATVISVRLLGWMALISGVLLAVGAFWRIRSGGFWWAALGGSGADCARAVHSARSVDGRAEHHAAGRALFLSTGLTRLASSGHFGRDRWLIVISGLVSVGLGLFVLFNMDAASLTLVGVLLGLQTLIEGMTLLVAGRLRSVPVSSTQTGRA